MYLDFLLKGLILGFSVSAPVGPIGILCINRTLHNNYKSGLIAGLGAASADLVYGLIAGFGLTVISNFLIEFKIWIQIFGLIFLFYIGIKTMIKKKQKEIVVHSADNRLLKDYLLTFFLTITNPATILFFITVFAGLGLINMKGNYTASVFLVVGVFLGSATWWSILSGLTFKFKSKVNNNILRKIDVIAGSIICLFGAYILYQLLIIR